MKKVTVYTTRTCPFCKMEKDFLNSNGIEYSEILVDEDPIEAKKMVEISGQMGVPFTVIDGEDGSRIAILGFDQKKISQTLGISN